MASLSWKHCTIRSNTLIVVAGIGVFAAVSEVPLDKNASTGQTVEFACATNTSSELVTWKVPSVSGQLIILKINETMLPGGGERSVIRFLAMSNTNVSCFVTHSHTSISIVRSALLLVQGKLIFDSLCYVM